jgi:hypothetical protein
MKKKKKDKVWVNYTLVLNEYREPPDDLRDDDGENANFLGRGYLLVEIDGNDTLQDIEEKANAEWKKIWWEREGDGLHNPGEVESDEEIKMEDSFCPEYVEVHSVSRSSDPESDDPQSECIFFIEEACHLINAIRKTIRSCGDHKYDSDKFLKQLDKNISKLERTNPVFMKAWSTFMGHKDFIKDRDEWWYEHYFSDKQTEGVSST